MTNYSLQFNYSIIRELLKHIFISTTHCRDRGKGCCTYINVRLFRRVQVVCNNCKFLTFIAVQLLSLVFTAWLLKPYAVRVTITNFTL